MNIINNAEFLLAFKLPLIFFLESRTESKVRIFQWKNGENVLIY